MYISETGSQYPVYADPSRALYDALGMQKTLAMGPRQPKYMRRSMVRAAVVSIVQGLKQLRKGIWVAKSGDQRQVGGEFLFVPPPPPDGQSAGDQNGESKPKPFRTVQWCHRMRNTRDHSEVETLVEVLGLDPEAVRRAEEAADQREAHELLHGRADKAAAAVPYVNGKATTSVHDVPGGTAPAVPAKS